MDLNGSQTWRFDDHAVTAGECWDRVPQNGVQWWGPWSNYSNYPKWITRRIADRIWNEMSWINFKGFVSTVFGFFHDFLSIKGVEWSFKKHSFRFFSGHKHLHFASRASFIAFCFVSLFKLEHMFSILFSQILLGVSNFCEAKKLKSSNSRFVWLFVLINVRKSLARNGEESPAFTTLLK